MRALTKGSTNRLNDISNIKPLYFYIDKTVGCVQLPVIDVRLVLLSDLGIRYDWGAWICT